MTEDARSLRQRMALLVEDVLSGKTSPSDAIDAANMFPVAASHDRLLVNAFHCLHHYRDDEDIRSKSDSYEERQRRERAQPDRQRLPRRVPAGAGEPAGEHRGVMFGSKIRTSSE